MDSAQTLSQTIADQLAEEIILRQIPPGTRMDEQSIASRFGVSRSPVRDALRLLTATHLVQYQPRRGFSSATVQSSELDDLFEAAGEIEALCARLCALRAGPSERKRIEYVHGQAQGAVLRRDTEAYSAFNDELHALIYAGAHNHVLQETALGIRQRLAPFRSQGLFVSDNRIEASNSEHADLVAAILAHDADAAARTMYNHAANSAMNVLHRFQED